MNKKKMREAKINRSCVLCSPQKKSDAHKCDHRSFFVVICFSAYCAVRAAAYGIVNVNNR